MGISRDSMHKRRATGGKQKAWRKKRKYELGRQPANTKLSPKPLDGRTTAAAAARRRAPPRRPPEDAIVLRHPLHTRFHQAVFTSRGEGGSIRLLGAEVGAAKMSDFQTSTHRERWIFQPQDLVNKWTTANRRSAEILAQYGTTRLKVDPVDGSISNPEPLPDHVVGSSSVKPLSCEEEQVMRIFYEQKIQEVCRAFKFPHKIQATAIIYFKRFYLQWSVMEHHPKHIMLTCVYASCKVEENHVSAEELGKGIQQDHQIILNNEMIVLKSLDFDLIVYAPYRSIEGFIDDMDDFCRAGNGAHQRLKDLHQTANSEVDTMMLTDAPLLYTPGQLALAALYKSNSALSVLDFERYLESVFSRQHFDCPVEQFIQIISSINHLVSQLQLPGTKEMRHADRKLKHCLDPSSSSHDDHKKKEKKSKHKSKRTASDAQLNS